MQKRKGKELSWTVKLEALLRVQSRPISADLKNVKHLPHDTYAPCAGVAKNSDSSVEERKQEILAWQGHRLWGGAGVQLEAASAFFLLYILL